MREKLIKEVKRKTKEQVSKIKPKDRKEIKNMDEVKDKIRNYILTAYETKGYSYAFKIAQSYMNDSTSTQSNLGVKDFATTVRGELSEIFLEVCIRDYVKKHKNTFYSKGLTIERKDGKPGFTELDLTLFTPNKVCLFESKSYSGRKRLIDEGRMVTDRFKPFDVHAQNKMHLKNINEYLKCCRIKSLDENNKPYALAMFSFSNEEFTDLRDEFWKRKFPLLTVGNVLDWLNNSDFNSNENWDIKKLYSIVNELEKHSESNFKKHLKLCKAKQDNS